MDCTLHFWVRKFTLAYSANIIDPYTLFWHTHTDTDTHQTVTHLIPDPPMLKLRSKRTPSRSLFLTLTSDGTMALSKVRFGLKSVPKACNISHQVGQGHKAGTGGRACAWDMGVRVGECVGIWVHVRTRSCPLHRPRSHKDCEYCTPESTVNLIL